MKTLLLNSSFVKRLQLHLFVAKMDMREIWQHMTMFISSRLTILGLKIYPPTDCKSRRLESDPRALFTMNSQEQTEYWAWLTKLRNKVHRNCCP